MFELSNRMLQLFLSSHSQVSDSVSPVQSGPDLFISLHEFLQLFIQVSILYIEQVYMLLQCLYLLSQVPIPVDHTAIAEPHVILFLPHLQ